MHKIGLKLWSINTGAYLTEALRLYEQGLCDYIELFVVPDTLETLSVWKQAPLPYIIHNAHFLQRFNMAKRECAARNREIYLQTRRFADELAAPHIIFHGGVDGTIEETARQLASFDEPRALLENKPFRALENRMGGNFCRGYDETEIRKVLDTARCGFCLDFGHAACAANSLRRDVYEYMEELLKLRPAMYHLTDVTDVGSEWDSHPHLGKGQFDFGRILSLLPPDSAVTLETQKDSKTDITDFESDVKVFRKYDVYAEKADMRSAKIVFALSNDPEVRKNSFTEAPIPWETHVEWMRRKVASPDCAFYLIRNAEGEFAAQIRFDRAKDLNIASASAQDRPVYEVSFSVAKDFRGRHFSHRLLRCGMEKFHPECGSHALTAWIKNDNTASIKCFERAGFRRYAGDGGKTGFIYENTL